MALMLGYLQPLFTSLLSALQGIKLRTILGQETRAVLHI